LNFLEFGLIFSRNIAPLPDWFCSRRGNYFDDRRTGKRGRVCRRARASVKPAAGVSLRNDIAAASPYNSRHPQTDAAYHDDAARFPEGASA